jgi:hypothetical protein
MEPTTKSKPIEDLLTAVSGRSRTESIKTNVCSFCGEEATSFKDALSTKEYCISGMCQKCQDKIWR